MQTTREIALSALDNIFSQGGKPKQVLEQLSARLDARERSFLMELTYGVVRYRDTLDWTVRPFLRRPSLLSTDTLNNLRLALYQILFMRVPEWAAVHEAVEIEKKKGKPALVNAVLRSLIRIPQEKRLPPHMPDSKGRVPSIALLTSHPVWLIRRWVKRLGEQEAAELAGANNQIPPLVLRVNTLRTTREQFIQMLSIKGIHAAPTKVSPYGVTLQGSLPFSELLPFRGLFVVQDEASQLISCLLDPRKGERILDACAAPGGKTTHIAQIMQDQGSVIAVERDEKRIRQLRENISALGLRAVTVVHADVTTLQKSDEIRFLRPLHFDRILLDAPCSSLGVIRRNPDIKYRHQPADLKLFTSKQLMLLNSVSRYLKKGGILVYSVCSTEPEEGEAVIHSFLKESSDFSIIDTSDSLLGALTKNGFLRTYPHKHGMDGFFGVKLCKKV